MRGPSPPPPHSPISTFDPDSIPSSMPAYTTPPGPGTATPTLASAQASSPGPVPASLSGPAPLPGGSPPSGAAPPPGMMSSFPQGSGMVTLSPASQYRQTPMDPNKAAQSQMQITLRPSSGIGGPGRPSEMQRHTKPKRLKAHTVTTKSFSIPVVPRDKNQHPMLPLNVGIMTVLNLGTICMREHFHTERYIFPIGYEVTRCVCMSSCLRCCVVTIFGTSQTILVDGRPELGGGVQLQNHGRRRRSEVPDHRCGRSGVPVHCGYCHRRVERCRSFCKQYSQ